MIKITGIKVVNVLRHGVVNIGRFNFTAYLWYHGGKCYCFRTLVLFAELFW